MAEEEVDIDDYELGEIQIITSDGKLMEISSDVCYHSSTLYDILKAASKNELDLPVKIDVSFETMELVICFCEEHDDDEDLNAEEPDGIDPRIWLPDWDEAFLNLGSNVLFDLIVAANYLYIKKLLDYSTQAVANKIKGRSVDEIRCIYNIKNDYPEIEEDEEDEQEGVTNWCE